MNPLRVVLPVEAELREERTHALKGGTEALEEAIVQWREADDAITAKFGEQRRRLVAARDQCRNEVERLLWNLIVQREALGLLRHEGLWVALDLPTDVQPHPHLVSATPSR